MRIVFFGTGEFSLVVLKGLLDDNQNVVGVVTQVDKVNARNGKIVFSPIKNFALNNNIPIYQFERLSRDGENELKALNPDLFVTASYGQIIKQNILDIPKFGTVNVHASLLPKYRGPAPIQWAIMNGEKSTGITIMRTELGLDTGDIYFSRSIDILPEDTSSSLFNKLAVLGAECMREFLSKFDYYYTHTTPQVEGEASYFPMIKKEDYLLNFDKDNVTIVNQIRALENCYFIYKGVRYKVLSAHVSEETGKVGEILSCNSKHGLVIACSYGAIEVDTIQPEGKQKMSAKSYMNSNKFLLGDMIENT